MYHHTFVVATCVTAPSFFCVLYCPLRPACCCDLSSAVAAAIHATVGDGSLCLHAQAMADPSGDNRPHIVLGVTGSVATVKFAQLAVKLSDFAEVRVALWVWAARGGQHLFTKPGPSHPRCASSPLDQVVTFATWQPAMTPPPLRSLNPWGCRSTRTRMNGMATASSRPILCCMWNCTSGLTSFLWHRALPTHSASWQMACQTTCWCVA